MSRPGGGLRLRIPAVSVSVVVVLLGLSLAAIAAPEEQACPALDQIHLRNGRIFEGKIAFEDTKKVVLQLVSESGGAGQMHFPRAMIARIVHGKDRAGAGSTSSVRDAWALLRSGGQTVGFRHLRLRHRKGQDGAGWQVEEDIVQFTRGAHVPRTRIHRMETVNLAFFPRQLHHREVGEASKDAHGPRRYERILTGPVKKGVWHVLVRESAEGEQRTIGVPTGVRGRLGTREHLLRRRRVGVEEVRFVDAAMPGVKTVRAGYTALGVKDPRGTTYDEFVWEEGGVRLVSRFRDAEVVEEWIAEGVLSVPASRSQVEAAEAEAQERAKRGEADLVQLPEVGLAMRLPGDTWTYERVPAAPGATGPRQVAELDSRYFLANVRIEWDPDGARLAPGVEEAEARLLQRLKAVCPDLRVRVRRRALAQAVPNAWRMELTGTLKGERVRTVAVVVDRGRGRAVMLASAPESAWAEVAGSVERLLQSLKIL